MHETEERNDAKQASRTWPSMGVRPYRKWLERKRCARLKPRERFGCSPHGARDHTARKAHFGARMLRLLPLGALPMAGEAFCGSLGGGSGTGGCKVT